MTSDEKSKVESQPDQKAGNTSNEEKLAKAKTLAKQTSYKERYVQYSMSDFNYYAVYGTMMGNTVKADSNLANELHHTLI